MPTVSIIIPLYNKEKFVQETLISVKDQTFVDWECIIINDGTTDNSVKIAQTFIDGDYRFKLIQNNKDKKGASAARNLGLKLSAGKYIQFLDADDILSSEKIAVQVQIMDSDINTSLATCAWGRLTADLNYILLKDLPSYSDFTSTPDYLNSLIYSKGYFPPHTFLIRKEIIEKAGSFNEFISLNDDGEFMARIIIHSKNIVFAEKAIVWYRTSDGNNLSSFNNKDAVEKAIYSWMLIEANLKISYGDLIDNFVEWSKTNLFINVNNSFPSLVKKHNNFFKNQIVEFNKNKSLKSRLLNRINRIFDIRPILK